MVKPTYKKYERKLNSIEARLKQKNLDAKTTAVLIDQMDSLKKERDAALEKLQEQAEFIANINKDHALDLVKSAIQKIEQEKDTDEALAILDNTKLEKAYKVALDKKNEGETAIQQVIQGYELKIRLLLSKFKYEDAIFCYERIIQIHKDNKIDKEELAAAYVNIAINFQALGQHKIVLEYQQKSINIREEVLDPKHLDLAVNYMNISVTYTEMKNFQKAIFFQKKCLAIFKEILPENHPYKKRALNNLAAIYNRKGMDAYHNKNYPHAIEAYQKAVTTFPEVRTRYFYNNIGMAYIKNKQFKEAYAAFAAYEKKFPNEGRTYRNWAAYHTLQNKKEKALDYLQKAVDLGYDDVKWLKADDSMESLRNEKAFTEIIEKLETSEKK